MGTEMYETFPVGQAIDMIAGESQKEAKGLFCRAHEHCPQSNAHHPACFECGYYQGTIGFLEERLRLVLKQLQNPFSRGSVRGHYIIAKNESLDHKRGIVKAEFVTSLGKNLRISQGLGEYLGGSYDHALWGSYFIKVVDGQIPGTIDELAKSNEEIIASLEGYERDLLRQIRQGQRSGPRDVEIKVRSEMTQKGDKFTASELEKLVNNRKRINQILHRS